MKRFIKVHPDLLLILTAALLLALVAVFYIYGISTLIIDLNRTIGSGLGGAPSGGTSFDIAGAKALNLRGLVQ